MKKKTPDRYVLPVFLRKFLLIVCLLFSVSLSHAAREDSTRVVTFVAKSEKLNQVLIRFKDQTGVNILFNQQLLGDKVCKDLNLVNVSIDAALEKILEGTGFTFSKVNDAYVIKKMPEKKDSQIVTREISGLVTDIQKEPLPGVTVMIKNSKLGVVTDINGKFKLTLPQNDPSLVLVFSFIGMEMQEVKVGNSTSFNVVLKEKSEALEDVVVTGYANISRKSYTGNVKSIASAELKKVSSTNVLKALQVLDPSFRLKVDNEMGSNPNAIPKISIRGDSGIGITEVDASSLSKTALQNDPNLPTFILDGFEVGVNKLFDMDMNRIESITLLKDAAATALYGSRGANGVVVITTFAPKVGEITVSYNYDLNIQTPDLRDYNLMNAKEKVEAEKEAGLFDEHLPKLAEYHKKLLAIEQGHETDWMALPLRNVANSKHYFRIEGGSNTMRYGIDVNYNGDKGVMKDSKRERMGFNLELQYNAKKLRIRDVAGYSGVQSKDSPYGSFSTYTMMNPYEIYQDENGEIPDMSGNVQNPIFNATIGNYSKNDNKEFSNNFEAQYYITDAFYLKGNVALTYATAKGESYTSPEARRSDGQKEKGSMTMSNSSSLNIDGGLFGYYNRTLEKHNINAVLGVNLKQSEDEDMTITVQSLPDGFANPAFAKEWASAPRKRGQISRLFGLMFSLNYTYNNIYLMDLTGRLDGNSSFGTDSRIAPFWSAGLGINIHNYPFMQENYSWISELKIRGSYGITGKANFPAKTARTTYELMEDYIYPTGVGVDMSALGNTKLKWERTQSTDFGGTIGLWNNRIYLNGAYYFKRTVDLIADMYIPASSGFQSYKENIGEIMNKGFELSARVKVVGSSDMQLYLGASVAGNKNRIEKISDAMKAYNKMVEDNYKKDQKPLVKYEEGASTSAIYAMKSLGIDPQSGHELFLYKDGTISTRWLASENMALGDTEPEMNGNFSVNFFYKGISLDLYFTYTYGGQQYNQTLQSKIENANLMYNVDKRVFSDRWKNPGDVCQFKSLKDYNKYTDATSRFIMDDNTLSLQSLSVGYELPQSVLSRTFLNRVRFTFSMNDLFRLSTIRQERGTSYPYAWGYNFSVNVGF